MVVQCWACVADGGPALRQHRVKVHSMLALTVVLLDFVSIFHSRIASGGIVNAIPSSK